jgi:hypothetical protein
MIGAMSDRRPRTNLATALIAIVLVAGCGSTPPPTSSPSASATSAPTAPSSTASPSSSTAPSSSAAPPTCDPATPSSPAASSSPAAASTAVDPNAATYTAIEGQVEQIRGLTATTPVQRNVLDTAGLCAFLQQKLAASTPSDVVAATDRLYKQLLLLPKDASLSNLILALMAGQVVGLYDQSTKQMYVVSTAGTIGPAEQITYAHEFDHALQDQAFDLAKVRPQVYDQGDRSLARLTLVEGDATLVMALWAQKNLTAAQMGAIANAATPASTAAFNSAPPILRETLMFPYTTGLTLTLGSWQAGGGFGGVDTLFRNPPDTTEQVMHADKLASREKPVPVAFPPDLATLLGKGWRVSLEDTFGEFQLGILARTGDPKAGSDLAAGWGGDRVALVEGPNGATAAIVLTKWDTPGAPTSWNAEMGKLADALNSAGFHAATKVGINWSQSPRVDALVSADSDATLQLVSTALGLAP